MQLSAHAAITRKAADPARAHRRTVCSAPRTIESLYKELVEEGLLIQALKVNLSDYIGKVRQE